MSNPRKPVRGKSERSKTQNGPSLSDKPAKSKTQHFGKTAPKPKTVAAEIGASATRKEPASVPPSPLQPPSTPSAAKRSPVAAKPAPVVPKHAPVAAKPAAANPAPVAAKPAPVAAKPAAVLPKPAAAEALKLRLYPLENAVETIQRSFRTAGQGSVAVNCKLLDFARANVISGLDHVKDLAAARTPLRVFRLQMEYWHDCLETFASQAQELRALQADLVAGASEPLRRQMRGTSPED